MKEQAEIVNERLQWYPALRYFSFEHLPEPVRATSARFHCLAWDLAIECPRSGEAAAGIRKLLEAKDCFVRAALPVGGEWGDDDDES